MVGLVYVIVLLFFSIFCFYIYRYNGLWYYDRYVLIVIFMVIDYKFMKVGWFVIL